MPDPEHRKALTKSLKYMARDIQLAVAAAELAFADAKLVGGGVDPTRIGVDLGAGLISTELDELAPAIRLASQANGQLRLPRLGPREHQPDRADPGSLGNICPTLLACHISILLDCQGLSNTITEAEAAANLAIGEASTRIIARGRADVMITGGADSKIHPLSVIRMSLLDQMSHWRGEPSGACRPFDRQRSGWVPGEGAGILILEEREHARARGARVYGEVLGFGSGCDANPAGEPRPATADRHRDRAAGRPLRDAGLAPAEMLATSTPTARRRGSPTWPRPVHSTASSDPAVRSRSPP